MPLEMNPIPAPGSVWARDVIFHSLHDAEYLSKDGSPTPFFMNSLQFLDGTSKLEEECNLGASSLSLPHGRVKRLERVALHVKGAKPEDIFKVRILVSKAPLLDEDMHVGWGNAATVAFTNTEGELADYLDLMPQEFFEVFVTPPERLRGAYAQVSLWGPFSVIQG